jgi:Tol biopolymer transport system component
MLSAGSRLGSYEIVSSLGAGGMGEVYRARDTKLQRDVALKILSAALAGDISALARFEREAQSVAQLSHPNILAIHDFGSDAGVAYAVTELLEGETLRERLSSGPLPPRRAVEYALQIARGLAAAHDKGIVHRDLKPENVFVTRDDRVKILDFGLAKPAALPAEGATMTRGVETAAGTVLGTFGYMAPEQVRALAVDFRTDIFAFGALLYEMLSGRRAFAGATPADTISAILHSEPADTLLTADGIPPALERIVRRALDKKPELRFQSSHDLAFALETLVSARSSAAHADMAIAGRDRRASARLARAMRFVPWAAAIAAIAFAAWSSTRPRVAVDVARVVRLDMGLPQGAELYTSWGSVAVSPDGQTVAFIVVESGTSQAYIRRLDDAVAKPVKGGENVWGVVFSPDGERLGAIVVDGSIRLITLGSGLVTPLAQQTDYFGMTWTANDEIVFTRDRQLWRVSPSGGAAIKFADAGAGNLYSFPRTLPDPDKILACVTAGSRTDVVVVSRSTGERRTLVSDAEAPLYAESRHLLFLRNGTLMAVPFDAGTLAIAGRQVPLIEGRSPTMALSKTGTLVHVGADILNSELVWVTRAGAERVLTKTPRNYSNPRVSPDGRQVLVVAGDFWIHDTERDTLSRLALPVPPTTGVSLWMPSGREVLYKTLSAVHRLHLDDGRHSVVEGTLQNDYPSGVSPDGRSLAVTRLMGTSADIHIISLTGDHPPRQWLSTPAYDGGAKWSPDGRWMAYGSHESGRSDVYLQPYPGPGVRRQVSVDGGSHPVWSRDGRELFYRHGSRLYAISVGRRGEDVALSQPRLLFDRLYDFGGGRSIANYDVSADGREFVFVKDSRATELSVVLNFLSEIEARAK